LSSLGKTLVVSRKKTLPGPQIPAGKQQAERLLMKKSLAVIMQGKNRFIANCNQTKRNPLRNSIGTCSAYVNFFSAVKNPLAPAINAVNVGVELKIPMACL
jgi:hypothetical protein